MRLATKVLMEIQSWDDRFSTFTNISVLQSPVDTYFEWMIFQDVSSPLMGGSRRNSIGGFTSTPVVDSKFRYKHIYPLQIHLIP